MRSCVEFSSVIVWVSGVVARPFPRYMQEVLPPHIRAKYDFECFQKGAATGALLDLTVSGAQPAAAIQQQVEEVGHEAWACSTCFFLGGVVGSVAAGAIRQGCAQTRQFLLCDTTVDQYLQSALLDVLENSSS